MYTAIQKEFDYGPKVSWIMIHGCSKYSVDMRVQLHLEAAFTFALVDSQFRLWAIRNQLELTAMSPNTTKNKHLAII